MRRAIRSWFWKVPVEQEVDEEIAFHLDMREEKPRRLGLSPDDARAGAYDRFGDTAGVQLYPEGAVERAETRGGATSGCAQTRAVGRQITRGVRQGCGGWAGRDQSVYLISSTSLPFSL